MHERNKRLREVDAFRREPILKPHRMVLIRQLLKDLVFYQAAEPISEEVSGDAKRLLEVVEAADSPKRVAQNEHGPAVADDGKRRRD